MRILSLLKTTIVMLRQYTLVSKLPYVDIVVIIDNISYSFYVTEGVNVAFSFVNFSFYCLFVNLWMIDVLKVCVTGYVQDMSSFFYHDFGVKNFIE